MRLICELDGVTAEVVSKNGHVRAVDSPLAAAPYCVCEKEMIFTVESRLKRMGWQVTQHRDNTQQPLVERIQQEQGCSWLMAHTLESLALAQDAVDRVDADAARRRQQADRALGKLADEYNVSPDEVVGVREASKQVNHYRLVRRNSAYKVNDGAVEKLPSTRVKYQQAYILKRPPVSPHAARRFRDALQTRLNVDSDFLRRWRQADVDAARERLAELEGVFP